MSQRKFPDITCGSGCNLCLAKGNGDDILLVEKDGKILRNTQYVGNDIAVVAARMNSCNRCDGQQDYRWCDYMETLDGQGKDIFGPQPIREPKEFVIFDTPISRRAFSQALDIMNLTMGGEKPDGQNEEKTLSFVKIQILGGDDCSIQPELGNLYRNNLKSEVEIGKSIRGILKIIV